jgi:hypothetical protein
VRAGRQPVRLMWSHRAALYAIGVGLWLSGGLWLLLHWIPSEPGAFGVRQHPLEPWTLAVHGALALAGTWMLGLLWGVHIPDGWSMRRRRRSGVCLLVVAAWLLLSGYVLYYLGDERVRPVISLLHWGAGAACPFVFVIHRPRRPATPKDVDEQNGS